MNRRPGYPFLTLKFKVHGSWFIVIEWPDEEGIVCLTMNYEQ